MNSIVARSNKDLEKAGEVIIVPIKEDVLPYQTPEEFIARLNKIESPNQRLLTMAKSLFYTRDEPTHEAILIRKMFLAGAIGGLAFGAIMNSGEISSAFIRNYNAAAFEGRYLAKRMYYDRFISGIFSRGLGYAFKTSLLTGTAGCVCFGSITYRNELYLPDWLIGFATLGGLTRLWLGSRAVAAGGLLGSFVGVFGFCVAKGLEAFSGYSVSQLKYIEHTDWLKARHSKHLRLLAFQQEKLDEFRQDD